MILQGCDVSRSIYVIVIATLQLVLIIEQEIIAFLGGLWLQIGFGVLASIFVIFGIFGAVQAKRTFLITYCVGCLLWIVCCGFVICFYLEVSGLKRESRLLSFGTKEFSWWLDHGIGCRVIGDATDASDVVAVSSGRRPNAESEVSGCILGYQYVELIHFIVHIVLSLLGILFAISRITYVLECEKERIDDRISVRRSGRSRSSHRSTHSRSSSRRHRRSGNAAAASLTTDFLPAPGMFTSQPNVANPIANGTLDTIQTGLFSDATSGGYRDPVALLGESNMQDHNDLNTRLEISGVSNPAFSMDTADTRCSSQRGGSRRRSHSRSSKRSRSRRGSVESGDSIRSSGVSSRDDDLGTSGTRSSRRKRNKTARKNEEFRQQRSTLNTLDSNIFTNLQPHSNDELEHPVAIEPDVETLESRLPVRVGTTESRSSRRSVKSFTKRNKKKKSEDAHPGMIEAPSTTLVSVAESGYHSSKMPLHRHAIQNQAYLPSSEDSEEPPGYSTNPLHGRQPPQLQSQSGGGKAPAVPHSPTQNYMIPLSYTESNGTPHKSSATALNTSFTTRPDSYDGSTTYSVPVTSSGLILPSSAKLSQAQMNRYSSESTSDDPPYARHSRGRGRSAANPMPIPTVPSSFTRPSIPSRISEAEHDTLQRDQHLLQPPSDDAPPEAPVLPPDHVRLPSALPVSLQNSGSSSGSNRNSSDLSHEQRYHNQSSSHGLPVSTTSAQYPSHLTHPSHISHQTVGNSSAGFVPPLSSSADAGAKPRSRTNSFPDPPPPETDSTTSSVPPFPAPPVPFKVPPNRPPPTIQSQDGGADAFSVERNSLTNPHSHLHSQAPAYQQGAHTKRSPPSSKVPTSVATQEREQRVSSVLFPKRSATPKTVFNEALYDYHGSADHLSGAIPANQQEIPGGGQRQSHLPGGTQQLSKTSVNPVAQQLLREENGSHHSSTDSVNRNSVPRPQFRSSDATEGLNVPYPADSPEQAVRSQKGAPNSAMLQQQHQSNFPQVGQGRVPAHYSIPSELVLSRNSASAYPTRVAVGPKYNFANELPAHGENVKHSNSGVTRGFIYGQPVSESVS